ncbi:2-succinyl-5-enolpyruvyl-6-hydroxy-3-cyclohexene-1-carboxylic-acid synthase [Altibacter lentus]|uniref:2-succinyl-5-enolpyruvyl-6-hydroxy-3- cyclohexene-1-carboxylic-acid synthase n=1 Tax=Altibacter lentus TaxID=1223410 RepID=UPI00055703BD|nr:2-succinyl-5-enolpyruvyl-6-hydroxy-3-cyclohexene-1-carboxylic-acid synthase [Altibacter lentus]
MKFSDKPLSQTVTQLCLAKGIDHIVISPGSRNAPLTIGFTEHPGFTCYSIVDERCAAFVALGMAQQLKRPVAVVCTSGSALLNYYPAVAEAFYSDIPLVVLSADRPSALLEIGDGQTIRQKDVFANHILYSANCEEGAAHQIANETLINVALNTAIELQGPVHINVPFSEPLYHTVDDLVVRPQHVPARKHHVPVTEDLSLFLKHWNKAERKMILLGAMPPHSIDSKWFDALVNDPGVVVFTEATSNAHHPAFFPSIDQLIAPLDAEGFDALRPQVLLTFGGMIVSKKVKAFLRNFKPEFHWHVDTKRAYDTYFKLDHHFKTTANSFLQTFLPRAQSVKSTYQSHWDIIQQQRRTKHTEYVASVPFSDFKVFSIVFRRLPKGIHLQLSNSATIRYAQLFDIHPSIEVFCNRGTSGIDGSTSTAIGAAITSGIPTVYITGDLSFFYDSNALWNQYIPKDFKIIVVNNGGGGIFRILPGAKEAENFGTFFETKHTLTAKPLCELFGFEYTAVRDTAALEGALGSFFTASEGPILLEIFTPSEVNDTVLLDYFKYIK